MKIYTKTGDNGTTSLIGGSRVNKCDLRIEAGGTLDELISYVGFIRDQHQMPDDLQQFLIGIQDRLMKGTAMIAQVKRKNQDDLPQITDDDITLLETAINQMEEELPPLHSFILPGGHPAVSVCHITRNVCRRAERRCVELFHTHPGNEIIIRYLNRLSDYLFVLARYLTKHFHSKEIPWNPFGK